MHCVIFYENRGVKVHFCIELLRTFVIVLLLLSPSALAYQFYIWFGGT